MLGYICVYIHNIDIYMGRLYAVPFAQNCRCAPQCCKSTQNTSLLTNQRKQKDNQHAKVELVIIIIVIESDVA